MEPHPTISISELLRSFNDWRAVRRSGNESTPADLCAKVRGAVQQFGAAKVCASIGMSQRRMDVCLGRRPKSKPTGALQPSFTELVVAPTATARFNHVPVCVIESPSGIVMTTYSADPLLVEMVATFVANLPPPARRC